MSSVQPLPLQAVAANDSAHSDDALNTPSGFHVLLGADGSVVIERSHDDVPPADAARVEVPAISEAEPRPAAQPSVLAVRPPARNAIAPARQLRWSFAGGALAATLLLVGGYELHARWSEALPRADLNTSTDAARRTQASGIVTGAEPPPVEAVDVAPRPPARPAIELALTTAPPAAGSDVASAVRRRAPAAADTIRERAPQAPLPAVGPCTPAVAALALCTLAQDGGP